MTVRYKKRRPYYDHEPEGYMESDNDYVLNNVELAVRLLDKYGADLKKKRTAKRKRVPSENRT